LETSRGEFARGIALGSLLLVISLAVMALIGWLSREDQR